MRKYLVVLSSIAVLACPVLGEDPVSTVQPPAAKSDAQSSASANPDEKVCRKQPPPTGSRLGAKTVCMTNRQWDELYSTNKTFVRGMQASGLGAKPMGAVGN